MTLVDWRSRPAAELARCYDAERASWARRFEWDTADNWRQVERARAAGTLPGLVAVDRTTLRGWCFFLKHQRTLQIGGIAPCPPDSIPHDRSTATILELLDGILASPEADAAEDVMSFTPDTGNGLDEALAARIFRLQRYAYLARPLEPMVAGAPGVASFHAGRLAAVADLLGRAYPGHDAARPFAPGGTPTEWLDYTAQLVTQNGCGTLLPWASVVEEDPAVQGRLVGAILATRIADQSAHLAQVAVDPACQGRGRGRILLAEALARLSQRGYTRVSLLVAADNQPAIALYEKTGFVPHGAFLSGWRLMKV